MRRFQLEILFGAAAALYVYAYLHWDLLALFVVTLLTAALGGVVAARWGRVLLRQAIWALRARLIVAYVFIAVIPILTVIWLTAYEVKHLGGQVAVYLVNSELERRVNSLAGSARALAQVPEQRRSGLMDRMEVILEERFPGMEIVVDTASGGDQDAKGIVVKDKLLYAWARAIHEKVRITMLAPVSRKWLTELSPGLGQVSIIHFPAAGTRKLTMRLHDSGESDADGAAGSLPAAANRGDLEVLWARQIPVALWENPRNNEAALLGVHSRLSAVLDVLMQGKEPLPAILYFFLGIFVLVEAISIYIGISITKTITGAVQNLYEGTARVMEGDFSHRIRVKGNDQVADLGRSFNRMTENIEKLLKVAKEKERIDTEIEIARQVQSQLFPKSAPTFENTVLKAACLPARTVSGDYYDYQPLPGNKAVLALGDVAGKGVSAALLMASVQACLRMQVADASEDMSPAKMVSRINQQLHLNTSAEKYATFFLAVYDDATGDFTYTNAGHLPPLLVRAEKATALDVNGMVVGAFARSLYTESKIRIEPGDVLIGYTDGISEAENEFGEMFGDERMKEVVERAAGLDADGIIHSLTEAARKFAGAPELQDDMTVMVLKRK
jgi:sigma-B regulation protein RsbU (phosphoserine phosphatase)